MCRRKMRTRLRSLRLKECPQNYSLVVVLIFRSIEQGDRLLSGLFFQNIQQIAFRLQFLTIPGLKLDPFIRIMAEPLAKFRTRRYFFEPDIHACCLFG